MTTPAPAPSTPITPIVAMPIETPNCLATAPTKLNVPSAASIPATPNILSPNIFVLSAPFTISCKLILGFDNFIFSILLP